MIASLCRVTATLAILGIPAAAVAQVVPGSALPGRERQQFETPQAPRAQPRGSVIALPSTVAPAGAESIKLTIRGIRITGSTVYSLGADSALSALNDGNGIFTNNQTGSARFDFTVSVGGTAVNINIGDTYGVDGTVTDRVAGAPDSVSGGPGTT